MVYRVQEVGKGLKGVDYSLHCSSAFKSKIELREIPSEKKNRTLWAIQSTGVREGK